MAVTPPDQVPSIPASSGAPLGIPLPYGQVTDYSSRQIRTKTTDEINTTFLPLSSSYVSLLDNVVENSTGSYSVTGYRQITHPQQQFDVNFTGVATTSNVSSSFPSYLTSSVAFYFESGNQVDVNLAAVCLKQPVPTAPNSDGKLALGIADTFSLGYLDNAETGPGIVGIVDLNTVRLTRDPVSGLFEPFTFEDATATTKPTFYNPNINTAPFGTEQTITLILDDLVYWIIVCYLGRPEDIANPIVDANAINGFPVDVRGLSIFAPSTFDIIKETTPFSTAVNSRTAPNTPEGMTLDQMLIEPAFTKPFYNTPCDVLINNAEEGRPNPFVQDVDYATSTTKPVNYNALASESAARSTIPESHYTQLSSINPRYNGAKQTTPNFNLGREVSSQYCGGVHALYYKPVSPDLDPGTKFSSFLPVGTLDLRDTVFNGAGYVGNNQYYAAAYDFPDGIKGGPQGPQYPNPNFGKYDPEGEVGTVPVLNFANNYITAPTQGLNGNAQGSYVGNFATSVTPGGYITCDIITNQYNPNVSSNGYGGSGCQNFRNVNAGKLGLTILYNVSASDGSVTNMGFTQIMNVADQPENFPKTTNRDKDNLLNYNGSTSPSLSVGYPPSFGVVVLDYIINPDGTIKQIQNTDSDLELVKSLVTNPKSSGEPFTFGNIFNNLPPEISDQVYTNINGGTIGGNIISSSLNMMQDIQGVFGIPSAEQHLKIIDFGEYIEPVEPFPPAPSTTTTPINLSINSPFGIRGTCIPFKFYNSIALAMFNTGSQPPKELQYSVLGSTITNKVPSADTSTSPSPKATNTIDRGIFPGSVMGAQPNTNLSPSSVLRYNVGGLGGFIYPTNIEFTDSNELPNQFIQILFDNNITTPEALYKNKTL